jgi:hypothetical protein
MKYLDPLNPTTVGNQHTGQVLVDFGFDSGLEGDVAYAMVSAPWVTQFSIILCNPYSGTTVDHDPDDVAVENIDAYATNIIPGVGFTIVASAPHNTWGKYLINYMGA